MEKEERERAKEDERIARILIADHEPQVREMLEETQKKQKELDLARAQYARSKEIRNKVRMFLDSVQAKMEDLKGFYDNPDAAGLQLVDLAPIPLKADVLPWQIYVPIGGGAGILIGVICALLAGRTGKPKQQGL